MACLEPQRLDKRDALAILQYYTRRNYVAYRSHRKTAIRRVLRVDPGGFPPGPPTDPHVPNSGMRFFES